MPDSDHYAEPVCVEAGGPRCVVYTSGLFGAGLVAPCEQVCFFREHPRNDR